MTARPPPPAVRPVRLLLAAALVAALAALAPDARAERRIGRALEGSTVTYGARTAFERWEGVAPAEIAQLRFDDGDVRRLTLEVRVPTDAFDSGNPFRDANARRVTFESDRYPAATFVATGVTGGPPWDLPPGAARELTLRGRLALHGVEREVEVPIVATREDATLRVEGAFDVSLAAFEMRAPGLFGIRVEDRVTVRLDLAVALEAP
jgi:polyisoprenoid-binding protein YceI